jgi:hypothetical protein
MGNTCASKNAVDIEGVEAIQVPTAPPSSGAKDTDEDTDTLEQRRKKSFWSGLELDEQSDEHSLEWINAIIEVGYPRFNKAMQADILPMVQQEVTTKAQALSGVAAITITSFDFGEQPPMVGPLDVARRTVTMGSGQAVEIRWKMNWESNCNINMKVSTAFRDFEMGLTKLTLSGEVTMLLCPIVKVLPCVAAVQVYMVSPPTLDFELQGSFRSMGEGMAQLLSGFVRNGVLKAFQAAIVEPNRMMILSPVVKLFHGKLEMNAGTKVDDPTSLKHPRPEILAEIGAIEAKGLTAKDFSVRGASSDPYAMIRLGDRDFRTKTVKRNVNPVWGKEGFADFLVFNMRQQVQLEVQDDDTLQDDLIGRLPPLTFAELAKKQPEDWYDIFETSKGQASKDSKSTGQVKLGYTLYDLSSDPETVKQPPNKKTKGTSFMQVQIKCLRGLTEDLARGAKVNVKVEGESNYTKGSKYVASKNRSDADATSQRLAEHLILQEHEEPETVAKVSGLDLETVKAIMQQKPSFTCRWFEGIDIILQDAMQAIVEVEVELKGGRTLKAQQPLMVAHLLKAPDMTFETSMRLEDASENFNQSASVFSGRNKRRSQTHGGTTQSADTKPGRSSNFFAQAAHATGMDRVIGLPAQRDSENERPHEVFDLDIKFALYGLKLFQRGNEPGEPASPGTSPKIAV